MSEENANSPEEQQHNAPDAPEPQDSPAASAEEAIDKVEQAADAVVEQATGDPESFNLPNFDAAASLGEHAAALGLLNDVDLKVTVELGRTRMYVDDVLRLNANSVVELDKAAGDPVDIYVNGQHVARGEVLVLNENFCVRVSEIIQRVAPDN